jgi:ADP-ribosylglycohydrolase
MVAEESDRIAGVILGTLAGDALGLPREGMSGRRAAQVFGGAPLRHRFLFGRGMMSDDTEHTCLTAQAMLAHPDDPAAFARSLAWKMRFWLLGLPAGVGYGTLRAILKLWVGFPPSKSGVKSAGNGPAMRAPVIGACLSENIDRLREFVQASARITHSDPRACEGALAVALCAAYAVSRDADEIEVDALLSHVTGKLTDPELIDLLQKAGAQLAAGETVADFAESLGLNKGVSGYIYHTVPVAIFAWLRHRDSFREALESVILLGGDTDTTGAIIGALAGAALGASAVPAEWLDRIFEWPRSVRWMRRLAENLAAFFSDAEEGAKPRPVHVFWPGLIPRNLLFMLVVLAHGFRQLLPPY